MDLQILHVIFGEYEDNFCKWSEEKYHAFIAGHMYSN
jgi:hypothetical protein